MIATSNTDVTNKHRRQKLGHAYNTNL